MSDAKITETWKMDDFLQKLKKVVRIVLIQGISQLDYRKTGLYQLLYNYLCAFLFHVQLGRHPLA